MNELDKSEIVIFYRFIYLKN